MATEKQTRANQENAQHSTGPSEEGKANSAGNHFKHGLCAPTQDFFVLLPGEDMDSFFALHSELVLEINPEGPTETLLVRHMAESEWLRGRASYLQTKTLFHNEDDMEKKLSLYIRYGKTHTNNFYKAFNQLLKLRKEKERSEIGFKSQELKQVTELRAIERQKMQVETLIFKKDELNFKKEVYQARKTRVQTPPAPPASGEMAA